MRPQEATEAVSFAFGPCQHGWIGMTISAGGASTRVSCSEVYDPFPELLDLAFALKDGRHGSVEIDEEGRSTLVWVDREPWSDAARLRVLRPDGDGAPTRAVVDVPVDAAAVAEAFVDAYVAYARSYDAAHWDQHGSLDDETGTRVPPADPERVLLRHVSKSAWYMKLTRDERRAFGIRW